MTITAKPLIESKQAEDAQTPQYTTPAGARAILDKFTATNTSAAPASLSVNLIPPTGSPGDGNLIVKEKTLAAGESYGFPELVGHTLAAGGVISTLASAAGAITIRASGREMT